MAVKAAFDLGWPVARLDMNKDTLELWTPPWDDVNPVEPQYICIQGKDYLEKLTMYLEQYYPSEGESEKG